MFPVKVTVLIDGNIMINIKISFLYFLVLVPKSAIVLQTSQMSQAHYLKCLPLLVVPVCLPNFFPVFLDFILQPNVNYSIVFITIKFHMQATGANTTMVLMCHLPSHPLQYPLSVLSGVFCIIQARKMFFIMGQLQHLSITLNHFFG